MPENPQKKIYLNYHNIGCGFQIGINKVNPIIFQNHIRIIEKYLSENPKADISITFDDGYENIAIYAQPFLKDSRIKEKRVFIITDYIGKKNTWDFSFYFNQYNHLNRDQIKALYSDGWNIGSHGASHRSFLSMSADEARIELISSKEYLDDIVGAEIKSIAPPFSDINQNIYDLCVEAGYDSIYLQSKPSIKLVDGVNLFFRNNIYSIDKNDNIISKINANKGEERKEEFISSFNNLTVLFSKIFK